MDYYQKYMKYKTKYLELKGGNPLNVLVICQRKTGKEDTPTGFDGPDLNTPVIGINTRIREYASKVLNTDNLNMIYFSKNEGFEGTSDYNELFGKNPTTAAFFREYMGNISLIILNTCPIKEFFENTNNINRCVLLLKPGGYLTIKGIGSLSMFRDDLLTNPSYPPRIVAAYKYGLLTDNSNKLVDETNITDIDYHGITSVISLIKEHLKPADILIDGILKDTFIYIK